MVLIDALFINMGGGKVLLDYLIEKLDADRHDVHFLLDERIKESHPLVRNNTVTYLKAGLSKRHQFYVNHGKDYKKVLCFASLPPSVALKAEVYTYFHQLLYLKVPKNSGFKLTLLANLKSYIAKKIKKHTNFWIVQSASVSEQLCHKYHLKADEVKIIPFYPPIVSNSEMTRKKETYAFVSLPAVYKNHERLIEAFTLFYQKTGKGELHLTVNDQFPQLLATIESLKISGVPIINHGFLAKAEVNRLYSSVEYVIFPSLAESFGLGIIEALENGCKIIGADLPYLWAVCEPSISFNPIAVNDMVLAFEKSVAQNVKESKQLVFNQVNELIALLN